MTCDVRRTADEGIIRYLAELNDVIRHETVSTLDELERGLRLTDTGIAHDQHTLAVYIDEHAVHGNHRCHPDLQPADDRRLQLRRHTRRLQQRDACVAARIDHAAIRLDATRIDDDRNRILRQRSILRTALRCIEGHQVRGLYITDDLHTLRIKLVEKTRKL